MKIKIDEAAVDRCRELAQQIVAPVERFISAHSTVSVERAVLRLFGIDGVRGDVPLVNLLVDALTAEQRARGAATVFCSALAETGLEPQALADEFASGRIAPDSFEDVPVDAAYALGKKYAARALDRISKARNERAK
ncbi:MAG: D-lysine 5,6-aminomutase subunit alpha, partial [Candidatus Eremiobacteraeota bacterium]|nr:D-lysine 5,6-aminomutase subunit alpha [Candidatus Eremiobacteraeota bacterium]